MKAKKKIQKPKAPKKSKGEKIREIFSMLFADNKLHAEITNLGMVVADMQGRIVEWSGGIHEDGEWEYTVVGGKELGEYEGDMALGEYYGDKDDTIYHCKELVEMSLAFLDLFKKEEKKQKEKEKKAKKEKEIPKTERQLLAEKKNYLLEKFVTEYSKSVTKNDLVHVSQGFLSKTAQKSPKKVDEWIRDWLDDNYIWVIPSFGNKTYNKFLTSEDAELGNVDLGGKHNSIPPSFLFQKNSQKFKDFKEEIKDLKASYIVCNTKWAFDWWNSDGYTWKNIWIGAEISHQGKRINVNKYSVSLKSIISFESLGFFNFESENQVEEFIKDITFNYPNKNELAWSIKYEN